MKRQSITHTVRACSNLTKSQYRKRHDNVGTYLHWLLCKSITYNAVSSGTHTSTQTHLRTNHNQPREITTIKSIGISLFKQIKSQRPGYQTQFVSTSKRECQIIAFAIPGDQNIAIKQQKKIGKYQVLIIELQKVWKVKVVVIPVVIGAVGENR